MSVRRIAELAGISIGTVSLALHNSPRISDVTKRLVRRIAKKIDYHPNAKITELMAQLRSTRTGSTASCFGVISFHASPKPWEKSPHHARIYKGMTERASELGYRLEPIWLRSPGMTNRRFKSILDARGIEGILSFGGHDEQITFPVEFDHFVIVTVGLTVRTPLHRVVPHFYNDTRAALEKFHALGYRRPGLVVGMRDEVCSANSYSSAYLGWCAQRLGASGSIPVLQIESVDASLLQWYQRHRPDSLYFVQGGDSALNDFKALLKGAGIQVPGDLGLAVGCQIIDGTEFSGMQQNQRLMGHWAIELLVSRVLNRDLGIPATPRCLMVESSWHDGKTLRRQPTF